MTKKSKKAKNKNFKPRARLLSLLGDQLIGTPQLAILELVKNSYDADADRVEIKIKDVGDVEKTTIEITDINGDGMTEDIIRNIWLEPGADHRKIDRDNRVRSKKNNRLPLGEKGVGRFAVHKLGRKIQLITKAEGSKEISLIIDWDDLDNYKYLDEFEVEITTSEKPKFFAEGKTGTRVLISKLKKPLTRGELRNLYRNIQSIKSPFQHNKFKIDKHVDSFDVSLEIDGHNHWFDDLSTMEEIVEQALFKFSFIFRDGIWSWSYEFNPNEQLKKSLKIESNTLSGDSEPFALNKLIVKQYEEEGVRFEDFEDLGEVFGEIYVFDFDKDITSFYEETGAIKTYLSENQGVRVYRDGVRVYNYGEPHDDWLQMDKSRVNKLGKGLNRSITVGGISLNLEQTPELEEKTNREGFVENDTFKKLFCVITSAISKFENWRKLDKDRLRKLTRKEVTFSITEIENPISELKYIVDHKGWGETLDSVVKRVEKSYNEMRDIMLTAGMAGLNMSVAFHEIDRGIKDTKKAVIDNSEKELILVQFERFELLLATYGKMLKKESLKEYSAKDLLSGLADLVKPRMVMHNITLSCPVLVDDQKSFSAMMPPHLMISAVNNLIDNSIFWLDQRWGESDTKNKYIYIGISDEFDKGPAIVIADSGAGWRGIGPEEVVRPFNTTKPGGMGIGLYYTNIVMEMLGGELVILNPGDIEAPSHADGAIVALVFKED